MDFGPQSAPRRARVRYIKSAVPAGRSREWAVEKFVVPQGDGVDTRPEVFRSIPGTYTRLLKSHEVFMTDLYYEWWTQRRPIQEAHSRGGSVLITGLGLGLMLESMLSDPECGVERVTVVEHSSDVIRLVAPHLTGKFGARVEIVAGDAFDWLPGAGNRFTVGWHDIWPNPYDEERWPEMDVLEQRFAPYCEWQGSWTREHLSAEKAPAEEPARMSVGGGL